MSTPRNKKIALLILGLVIVAAGVFGAGQGVGVAGAKVGESDKLA